MEVLTLQVGHYANFVGSHFWNLQSNQLFHEYIAKNNVFATSDSLISSDSTDPNILCRETVDRYNRNVLVPRLISIDLKGSLNLLREDGTVGKDGESSVDLQSGFNEHYEIINFSSKKLSQSGIPDEISETLEDESKGKRKQGGVWSDFLVSQYHPKSIVLLDDFRHDSKIDQFTNYCTGLQYMHDHKQQDLIEENLHYFLEECDNPQGIQVIADVHDAFGGLTTGLLEMIKEIAGKITLFTYCVWPPTFDIDVASLNSALSLNTYVQHADMILPISTKTSITRKLQQPVSFPLLNYQENSYYDTSAVLATFIDTFGIPCRTKSSDITTMNGLSSFATVGSKAIVASGLCLPLTSTHLSASGKTDTESCITNITPYCNCTPYPGSYGNITVLRGRKKIDNLLKELCTGGKLPATTGIAREFNWLQNSTYNSYTTNRYYFNSCPIVVAPYPKYFEPEVVNDVLSTVDTKPGGQGLTSVATMANVCPSKSVYDLLFNIYIESRCLSRNILNSFHENGLDAGDLKEILEDMLCKAESYDPSRQDFNDYNGRAFRF